MVKREVTRVVTPGTAIDPGMSGAESCWLAAVAALGAGAQGCVGVAMVDLSTGEFRATEFSGATGWAEALDELGRLRPAELLYAEGAGGSEAGRATALRFGRDDGGTTAEADEGRFAGLEGIRTKTAMDAWVFTVEHAHPLLRRQFGVQSVDGLGLGGHGAATAAAGAVLEYLGRTKQGALEHVDGVRFYERSTCLQLDAVSVRNLELVEPIFAGEGAETTLFWTMDACLTPMGKRLLRSTLLRPAGSVAEIAARLDAVGEGAVDLRRREELRRALTGVLDMERLLGRVALNSAGPREVLALALTLARLPGVREAAGAFAGERWRRADGGARCDGGCASADRRDAGGGAAGVAGGWRSDPGGRLRGAR